MQQVGRSILLKVLETKTEADFFEKMFTGHSVTIDAQSGELVYVSEEQLDQMIIKDDELICESCGY